MASNVDINAYIYVRDLVIKIFVLCIMLIGTIYFSAVGFDILKIHSGIVNSNIYKTGVGAAKDLIGIREEAQDRPMLDDPRLIALGDKEINATIDVFNTELDLNEISESEKNDFGGHYPQEIAGHAQEVYIDRIPEEHKDVVKEYFKTINHLL